MKRQLFFIALIYLLIEFYIPYNYIFNFRLFYHIGEFRFIYSICSILILFILILMKFYKNKLLIIFLNLSMIWFSFGLFLTPFYLFLVISLSIEFYNIRKSGAIDDTNSY
jgi:hypothetical protein